MASLVTGQCRYPVLPKLFQHLSPCLIRNPIYVQGRHCVCMRYMEISSPQGFDARDLLRVLSRGVGLLRSMRNFWGRFWLVVSSVIVSSLV
jgi:hypothetical protein